MKKILILLLIVLSLCGCNNVEKDNRNSLNSEKIEELMSQNEYIIVDVRTNEEYNVLHVVDSVNISYDEIDKDVKLDKNKIIFVYCKSGNRSKLAYETLTDLGYIVYDLGGISDIDLPKVSSNN